MSTYRLLPEETERFLGGSYNKVFMLCDERGDRWVGKFTKRLKNVCDMGNPDIFDGVERTLCADAFVTLCRPPVSESRRIALTDIAQYEDLVRSVDLGGYYNVSTIAVSRFVAGKCVQGMTDQEVSAIPPRAILELFVFDLWLGNFDKKEEEYLYVPEKEELRSFDYEGWGPRDKGSRQTLGFCARVYDVRPENFRFCLPDRLRSVLLRLSGEPLVSPMLSRIEAFGDGEIRSVVQRFDIRGTQEYAPNFLNETIVDFLIWQRGRLRGLVEGLLG